MQGLRSLEHARNKQAMKSPIFLLVLLIFWQGMRAQSMSGRISDSATHEALSGVTVYFPQLKLGAVTDGKGYYRLSPLPKGTYEAEMQMIGYGTLIRKITINGDIRLDFALTVSSSALKAVLITSLGNVTNA